MDANKIKGESTMITKDEYEYIYKTLELARGYISRIKLQINDMTFMFESGVYKSKFNIFCFVKNPDGIIKSVNPDNEQQKIICDTKIIISYFNRRKSKLTKRELKTLNETLSEKSKNNYEYKAPFWSNSRKFINHLKKLQKQKYEISLIKYNNCETANSAK